MEYNRRSLIIGAAGVASSLTKIIPASASDLISIPYSVQQAKRWAVESFNEFPQCRLVFSDGTAYSWFKYQTVVRNEYQPEKVKSFAVAIEVAITDAEGHRSIHTMPVDGYGLYRTKNQREAERNAAAAKARNEWLSRMHISNFEF